MHKTSARLADGREIIYYDRTHDRHTAPADLRQLPPRATGSTMRCDATTGDWIVVAGHRQKRTFQPQADQCPLCPSRDGRLTEVPASDYDVVVFENRFPALAAAHRGEPAQSSEPAQSVELAQSSELAQSVGPGQSVMLAEPADAAQSGLAAGGELLHEAPADGRCEVICFSSEHDTTFAELKADQVRLVLEVWADRTRELSALPSVRQTFCFENRGPEMGVTQPHPHGQIYAYPFVTARTARMLTRIDEYRRVHHRNLFDDLIAAEINDGRRVVRQTDEWIAFVPYAARWPYEVHIYPLRRQRDLTELDDAQRDDFPGIYLDMLQRFERLFDTPTPYVAAWHQAPVDEPAAVEFAAHVELFTNRRSSERLKVLGGTEVGMDSFSNDVGPERAALRLRELGD